MKIRTALLAAILVLGTVGCPPANVQKTPPAPTPVKVVVEKQAVVEQRTTYDLWEDRIRGRAVTAYYLVAEDGDDVEVTRKEYNSVQVGDEWEDHGWD